MKKYTSILLILIIAFSANVFSQNDTTPKKKLKPVLNPWFATSLIDAQTTFTQKKGDLELVIHHRFTSIENGFSDLFGFYGASNIRLGVNYGITNRLTVGFGTEKDKKTQEFLVKYKILQQSRCNTIPVSVAFYGNAGVNTREEEYFGVDYKFTDRMSYYSQLIVSRKWTSSFTTLVGVGYAHINKVTSNRIVTSDSVSETISYHPKYYNNVLGLTVLARLKLTSAFGLIAEYEQPIPLGKAHNGPNNQGEIAKPLTPQPNVAFGFEITTVTHSFQMFASSYRGIVPQNNLIMNNFDFKEKNGIMLGFNVIVKF